MTKKDLQEYYWLQKNIQRLEDKLLELETQAAKMTSVISDEPRSGETKDKLSGIVAKIVEVQTRINEQLYRSYELAEKIEKAIETLPERERYLIRARYIDCKAWEKIAVDMHYSWKQTHRIHSEALKMLVG
ncbi:hypothetical protein [Geosporobacter ferrireducens]|uniref:hypothetical protein n=1 Tax=Geosporobacter ferrireducens TaxID=1424294 RepID=UPI00139E57F7|nr:hypothetical protein [Geosporobacter ferrireducens]MTI56140.1 sigma-70 family RNA polymerase sigma factor [Geosporobacter ferrireducens]